MQEVFRTGDPAEIALIRSLLDSAKIRFFVFDEHLSGALGLDAFESRFMVLEPDAEAAAAILQEAGFYDVEVEILVTSNLQLAEDVAIALDKADIEYFLDEDEKFEGLIAGVGKSTLTYRYVVMDYDLEAAREALKMAGIKV